MTFWSLSRKTLPCICPLRPMPFTSDGLKTPFCTICLTELIVAFAQSSGFCSDQPGLGLESGYSIVTEARIVPSSRIAIVLVPLVPISMPRKTLIAIALRVKMRMWEGNEAAVYQGRKWERSDGQMLRRLRGMA